MSGGVIPPGLNNDGILGYIAATVTDIKKDLGELAKRVLELETRIARLEDARKAEEQARRQIVGAGRFLWHLPPALIAAAAGFFGGKAS